MPSIGAWLRSQRLMRGIGLGELAAVTRIPRRSLERLEAGEFDRNPDGFARGFVRAVSSALGLDPDEAVSRMLVEPEPEAGESVGPALRRAGLVLAVAAALLAAVLLWSAVSRDSGDGETPEVPTVTRRDAVTDLADRARRTRSPAPADASEPVEAAEGRHAPVPAEGRHAPGPGEGRDAPRPAESTGPSRAD